MRKIVYFFIFSFLLLSVQSFAQEKCKLRGEIKDSLGLPIFDASISAFNSKNEGVAFTFSDIEGNFVLEIPCQNTYDIEVEHINYESYTEKITIDKSRSVRFKLKEAIVSLEEAVIRAKQPITIKGDTIEYDADSFRTVADENLEDLLKKLPGLQVENGKVYYEGKEIKTIKVGNREVLGGNTKLLTKNLPADAVDKIQLNKKFKANPFSNSMSDDEEAMLNIELKEDKKSLVFGNVTLGGDSDDHSDVQSKLFYFSPKTDATSITDFNTYGKEVFTYEDYFTFLGGISELRDEGSSFSLRQPSNSISLGTAQDAAEMNAFLSALHFGYEPNKKWMTNAFVLFNQNDLHFKSTQERIGDQLTYRDEQVNNQKLLSTVGRIRADFTPNSRSQWKYRASFNYLENTDEQFADTYLNEVGTGKRNQFVDKTSFSLRQNLSYIKKVGSNDNLGFYLRHQWLNDQPETSIFSDITPISLDGLDLYDVNQTNKLTTQNLQLYGIYNHLLNNTTNLRFKAGSNFSWQKLNNSIYEGQTLINQDFFQSKSDFDFIETYVDLTLTKKFGPLKIDAGVGLHHFDEKTTLLHDSRSVNFTKFLPHINTELNLNNVQRLSMSYNQSYQLANLNDLNEGYSIQNYYSVYKGFLGLKEALYHNVGLQYGYFNSFNFLNFYAGGTYQKSVDNFQIASDMSNLPQINSLINNLKDDQNLGFYFGGSKRFNRYYSLRLNANLNYLDYYTSIKRLILDGNNSPLISEEMTHNTSFIQNYSLTNQFKFKKKIELDAGLNYVQNNFNALTKNEFVTWRPFAKLAWSLHPKLLLQSDYSYRIQYQDDELINENQALNASLRFHLAKSTYFTLIGGNLLGDERIVNSSFNAAYNQTIVNTRELLGRYFLVQLRYKF